MLFLDFENVTKERPKKAKQCRVDFFLTPVGWAIDFLRQGKSNTEVVRHLYSLEKDKGKYKHEKITEWRVVDFVWKDQKVPSPEYLADHKNLIVLDFRDVECGTNNIVKWITWETQMEIELIGTLC